MGVGGQEMHAHLAAARHPYKRHPSKCGCKVARVALLVARRTREHQPAHELLACPLNELATRVVQPLRCAPAAARTHERMHGHVATEHHNDDVVVPRQELHPVAMCVEHVTADGDAANDGRLGVGCLEELKRAPEHTATVKSNHKEDLPRLLERPLQLLLERLAAPGAAHNA